MNSGRDNVATYRTKEKLDGRTIEHTGKNNKE